MDLLTLKDVMQLLGVGRVIATRILRDPKCPTLPRVKNGPYLVPRKAFVEYVEVYRYEAN